MLFSNLAFSQSPSGVFITWDKQVGCQTFVEGDHKVYLENIEDSNCIKVCAYSSVNYTITGLPIGATTVWNANGGAISSPTNTTCLVNWSAVGDGNLSFTITNGSNIISKSLCIEKVEIPGALFEIAGQTPSDFYFGCKNQTLNFINLSSTGTETNLMSYFWEFGDGQTSAEFEPSHIYTSSGDYSVTLIVTNSCNCVSKYNINIHIEGGGFDIQCPSVVCEDQNQIYSLPFNGMEICNDRYNWSVIGGTIVTEAGGNVEVFWDNVDSSGFGYVTFIPENCRLDCLEPSTIKIPVIQTNGTIVGPTDICFKEQAKYKLPQWPTTDFQWEIIGNEDGSMAQVLPTDQRNEVVITPLVTGTLILRATYMNTLLQCGGTAEFTIHVNEPIEVIGADVLCQFTTATYTNSASISSNWVLKRLTGTTSTTVASSSGIAFSYPFNIAGNYILTTTASGYCQGEQLKIKVLPKPTVPGTISGLTSVCPNVAIPYEVVSPDLTSTYYWEITNGYLVGANEGVQVNIIFTSFPATIKIFKQTVFPEFCSSDPKIITINQIPIVAEILDTNTSAVCPSSTRTYTAVFPGTTMPHNTGDSYIWSFSNPSLGTITNGQGTNTISVIWNNVNVNTAVDLILTINKCTITPAPTFIKPILILATPQIQLNASATTICGGGLYDVTFSIQPISGTTLPLDYQVTWNLGGEDFTTGPGMNQVTHYFENFTSTNSIATVTAFISNASCGTTNVAQVFVTILPNPPAVASLNSAGNSFCEISQVNAELAVASEINGVSIQWFLNGNPIPGATNATLLVTPSLGYGAYTFQATSANGCIKESNPIHIIQSCENPPCLIFPEKIVTNTSYLSGCGTIDLVGTATPTYISQQWEVYGPPGFSISGNTLTGDPGKYHIYNTVKYYCTNHVVGKIQTNKNVVIPYKPDFNYTVTCNPNNTFDVNLIDNSNFYSNVTNQNVQFSYCLSSAYPAGLIPITGSQVLGLAPGNYKFKITNNGLYEGVAQPTCEKVVTLNLTGISAITAISVDPINCHDTPVQFGISPLSSDATVLWTFEPGVQNSLVAPKRVFNAPGTYLVSALITNKYGCTKTLTTTVVIPERCFFGDIVSTPSPATACKGTSIELKYQPSTSDACVPTAYTWMNGNTVLGTTTTNSKLVYESGIYWVKVLKGTNCFYNTPSRITPVFNNPPSVSFIGENAFCEQDEISVRAVTNATNLQWFFAGVEQPSLANNTQPIFDVVPAGTYVITLVATSSSGCSTTKIHTITVYENISDIDFNVTYACNPFRATITATASSGTPIYNWSNGANGATITVYNGGPYLATATIGGCSYSEQITIAKNPEVYSWIFPQGCFQDCINHEGQGYLLGPNASLNEWSWNLNNHEMLSGVDSFPEQFNLSGDGSYTLTLGNEGCSFETNPLDYQSTNCDECDIRIFRPKFTIGDTPFCSFTFELTISSNVTFPYSVTLSDIAGNIIISPATFILEPGVNLYTFTIIPVSPFIGGLTTLSLQGYIPNREADGFNLCQTNFDVVVPQCANVNGRNSEVAKNSLENDTNTIVLYPNPAKEQVTIDFVLFSQPVVSIFDLTGRLLIEKQADSNKGSLVIDTTKYPSGIYIVLVKQNDKIISQQKLIIE
jgi:hypothetical protein